GARPPEPKPREQRLSECGVEGVEVDQFIRGDGVEGQRAARTVHKHCHSPRRRGPGLRDDGLFVFMKSIETVFRTDQTPGLIVVSKQTVNTFSF
ncbi:hypothetical protein NL108_014430, partial [Boleophthalmus pectinirostris]